MGNIIQSILAGLGGMFAWGTSDFFAGLFSKKIGYFKTFFWSQSLSLSNVSAKTKSTVAVVGILEAAAVASVNWGLIVGDVILVTPISSALSIITIAMAIVFLKEKITKSQGFGMAVVIGEIILTAF